MAKTPIIMQDPRNANKGTVRGRGQLELSLEKYGAGRSILVDKKGRIIAGNKTAEIAQELGLEVQVIPSDGHKLFAIQRTDLDLETDTAAMELGIADNRTSEVGLEWDGEIMQELLDAGADVSDFFFDDELDEIIHNIVTDDGGHLEDPEEIPEPPAIPTTKPGDLWLLGNHRLKCGDSRELKHLQHLFSTPAAAVADLMVTDPPYGVAYVGKTEDALTIENDEIDDEATRELVQVFLMAASSFMRKGAPFYIFAPAGNTETAFRLGVQDASLELRQCLVWVKQQFVMGRQDYHWRHESILYGWYPGAAHYFVSDRTQDTVWEFDRPSASRQHPTMKPLDLVAKAVRNSSVRGGVVYDAFVGSGTTLLVCEETERICCAMELSPAYCDVTVQRWEEMTGQKAVRA